MAPKKTSITSIRYEEFKKQAIIKNPKATEAKYEETVKKGYQDYLNSINNKQIDPQTTIDKIVYPKQQTLNNLISFRDILASAAAKLEICEQLDPDLVNKIVDSLNKQKKQLGLPTITINPTMKQWLGN